MGFKQITLKLPTDYTHEQLVREIGANLRIRTFTFQIERQSLDARKKTDIHWQTVVAVVSEELGGGEPEKAPALNIPFRKRGKNAVVVGSGPAGFFAALILQKAGFDTTLIERGSKVSKRAADIRHFETTGKFFPESNYAFGEGGAGTFSDGKLTARTKNITAEKDFMLAGYIIAGAPAEIGFMAHPHVGSDNLRVVVQNLRAQFLQDGGTLHFETRLEDIIAVNGRVTEVKTTSGALPVDELVLATGHSAYETYRMLLRRGVAFQPKNFAIGFRAEHPQEVINMAQWGRAVLPGVKAAEYRLTARAERPVFTFCMCPGGTVVPATAYANTNIVNGMSYYKRDGKYANAACVAGVHPDELAGRALSAADALSVVEELEQRFFDYAGGYAAPACSIQDFMRKKESSGKSQSSYPLGTKPAPLWEMLPQPLTNALCTGLKEFGQKLRGYESGNFLGLESKTSAPIQVKRARHGLCDGYDNLYLVGEGSGWAGGIVSSGVDGIRAAMAIVEKDGG